MICMMKRLHVVHFQRSVGTAAPMEVGVSGRTAAPVCTASRAGGARQVSAQHLQPSLYLLTMAKVCLISMMAVLLLTNI